MENGSIWVLIAGFVVWWRPVSSCARLSLFWRLQLDRQLVRSDFDSGDMAADEVAIVSLCGVLEMLADGTSDESFDLGRRHPAHGSGPLSLSLEQG
jgi:hypothetical protein